MLQLENNVERMSDNDIKGLLTLREALDFLRERYPTLKEDTLYHRVTRGKGIPHTVVYLGKTPRYLFEKSALEKVHFFVGTEKKSEDVKHHLPLVPYPAKPMPVHTSEDILRLTEMYGPLVDDDGLINAIQQIHGRAYTKGALKQKRRRKTIGVVGVTGRKRHWYPLAEAYRMTFQG